MSDVGRREEKRSMARWKCVMGVAGGVVDIDIDVEVGVGKNGAYKVEDHIDIDIDVV